MKIYLAGGEGLPKHRQKSVLDAGCKGRLVSFYAGKSAVKRVVKSVTEWERGKEGEPALETSE